MALSIADQIALDDALVAPADRLKIGKCNLRLSSDVTSKEATLQVVYDVLKITPFYKAFQVTADAPEIYMQEFWASAYVHNRSVRFKMNNKKHIIGLEQFRDILQICPKVGNKKFVDPPLEKEILIFLASLGHSGDIRKLTDSTSLSELRILWEAPHCPQGKESGKGKQKSETELKNISEADMNRGLKQPKSHKKKRQESHCSHAMVLEADEGTWYIHQGFPMLLIKTQRMKSLGKQKAQDDDDEELTESDNDDDDFVHPKLTTHDDEIIHEEDTDEDDSSISSSDEEDSDNDVEGANVAGAKSDEDATDEKDQGNEAVKDTNTDLDGRDKVMTDVEDTHVTLTLVNPDGQQQSSSVSSGFVSSMLNPNQDTGVDDIFRQHTEATSLIDTNVTAIMEPFFTEQINRPPTPHPIIIQPQQLPILTPATTTSSSLQNLPNFASLFGFDHRLKALEDNFSDQAIKSICEALSSILSQSSTANQQFLESIDDGMKKIIKEQVKKEVSKIIPKVEKFVTDQLESEVLVRSSKEANTSHAVAANLSELELKKILIDKMKANNSINRSDIQRQLYKVLVEAYEADKILLDTYGDTVTIKRPRDGADDDEEPSAGTDRGSKRRRSGKEPASTSAPSETTTKTAGKTTSTGSKTHKKSASQSAPVGEAMHSTDVFKGPADQEFETGVQDEQAEEEVQHPSDWFQKPTRLPSPDHAWNTSVPAVHESVQPWLSNLAQQDPRESFDELTDSTFDFSAFVLNRLNVQTLTPELLAGPTFELMKGTCKSLTELEYFCEEVYKATTEKLDWINPEGRQYPHDLRQPLPLIPNSQGRRVIPFNHFINNDLEYLRGGVSSRKYSTSVTKTQAADYGHIKWIEDLVPNSMWSQTIVKYDKFALWGVSHWGKKRRQFYAFAALRESARDVYSKRRIIAVTKVEIVEWHDYKHLDWITVRRDDDVLYKFKEGDFHRLRIQDIEDMLLLLVQGKVTNLSVEERIAFNVSLRMFTRSVVIATSGNLQTGVESYHQKKLNLTKPDTDGTLDDVRTALNDRLKGIRMAYLPQTFWSQRDQANARAMIQAIDKRLKTRRIMRSLERFVRFNTSAGNPVKKILLKLNLSDHRLCKMVVEVPDSSWLTRSITTCSYPTDKHKVIMKAQSTTTPSLAPTSEVPNASHSRQHSFSCSNVVRYHLEQQTDPFPRPSPSPIIPDTISKLLGELEGHSSNQAKEIQNLKAQIKKLKKQAKPVIHHHRAWLKSVSLK
ncbi:hypothetical protein Tco_0535916 [Tanacetum coccineum]